MAGWQAHRSLRIGVAAVAGAIAVGLIAPAAAEAASAQGSSSHSRSDKNKNKNKNKQTSSGPQTKKKAVGSPNKSAAQGSPQRSSAAKSSPGAGQAPKQKSKKDKAPDRGPHKAVPQRPSQAGHSSPGAAGSGPKAKVGVARPDDRGPNKVAPQPRTPAKPAPGRDTSRRDKPATGQAPAQGFPDLAGVAGSALQQLEPWLPRKPKTDPQTRTHDLAYRYLIVNGQPVDRTANPLDWPGDDDLPFIPGFPDGDADAPPVLQFPGPVPGFRLPPAGQAPKSAAQQQFVRGGKLPHARDLLKNGTETAGVRGGGRFPTTGAKPNQVFYRVNPQTGKPTSYAVYDTKGVIIKRVDLEGAAHGGVKTPHVVDYKLNRNPQTGTEYPGPTSKLPRPATPEEIP